MRTYEKPKTPHDNKIEYAKAFYLLDAAHREKKQIKIYYHSRRFLDAYRCIDTPQRPIITGDFTEHGEIIYIKSGLYSWLTISFDDIDKIEIIEA